MSVVLVLILQCLHVHILQGEVDIKPVNVTKLDANTKVLRSDLEDSLDYSKAHVSLKGPRNEIESSSNERYLKSVKNDLTQIDTKEDNSKNWEAQAIDNESQPNGSKIKTENIVSEKVETTHESRSIKTNQSNWPASSYASASSWAGSYGRPSAGDTAASAQATASAGHSSATSSSSSSSGTGYYGGTGSNAASQLTTGIGSGPTRGTSSATSSGTNVNSYYKPTESTCCGGNAGSNLETSSPPGLGYLSGPMTFQGTGGNSGTVPEYGSYHNYYFRPPSNTGVSIGQSTLGGLQNSGSSVTHNTGYTSNTQNLASFGGSGSADGSSSSFGAGLGSNSRPGGYYNGFKPTNIGSGGINSVSPTVSAGGSSSFTGYQGNYNNPTSPSGGPYSAGYYGSYNRPSSGSLYGSTSSGGTGSLYSSYNKPTTPYAGNYSPYNRPATTSSGSYNYNKPSNVGYGGYYGGATKPNSQVTSVNLQSFINKPPSGGYYNGQFVTTSPNVVVKPYPPSGTGGSTSGFSSSTSGSSSGIGIIPAVITNPGISTTFGGSGSTYTPVFPVPWWLEAGVFNTSTVQEINASTSSSNNLIPGTTNFETSMVLGTGGATGITIPGTGNQEGGPSSEIIGGNESANGSLEGTGTVSETLSGGINLGLIPITGTNMLSNSSSILPVGLGSSTGSSQGLQSSSGVTIGPIEQAVINPGLISDINSTFGSLNSGPNNVLPWWFLTGVFSGSVHHQMYSVSTDSTVGINKPVLLPGGLGITGTPVTEPANNLGPFPSSGIIGSQNLLSTQYSGEVNSGIAPNFITGPTLTIVTHPENPNVGNLTGSLNLVLHPEENIYGSSGFVMGPTKPGELPTTPDTTVNQVGSVPIISQPGTIPISTFENGPGHPVGETFTSNSQQGISQSETLPGSSGLATTATHQQLPNAVDSLNGQAQLVEQGKPPVEVNSNSTNSSETNFPVHTRPGVPSVSDIAISLRPEGWSGGDNGPATLIGSQSKPMSASSSGSGASSSSFAGSSKVQFPHKVRKEDSSDIGTIKVQQTPSSDSSTRYQTGLNKIICGSDGVTKVNQTKGSYSKTGGPKYLECIKTS